MAEATSTPTAWDYDDEDMGRDNGATPNAVIAAPHAASNARGLRTGGLGFALDMAVRDSAMQSYGMIGRNGLATTTQVTPLPPELPLNEMDLTDYVPDAVVQSSVKEISVPTNWRDSATGALRWWAEGMEFNRYAAQGFIQQGLHAVRGMAEFGLDATLQAVNAQTLGVYEDLPLFRDAVARQQGRVDAFFSAASSPVSTIKDVFVSIGTRLGEGVAIGGARGGYIAGGATFDAAGLAFGGAAMPKMLIGAYDSGALVTREMSGTLRQAGLADWEIGVRPYSPATLHTAPLDMFEFRRLPTEAGELLVHQAAAKKGFLDVYLTRNGGPTFAQSNYLYPIGEGQLNIVEVELTGSRSADFRLANSRAGFDSTPSGYVWHHVDDLNPATMRGTLELVLQDAHVATYPHRGSVSQWERLTGKPYR